MPVKQQANPSMTKTTHNTGNGGLLAERQHPVNKLATGDIMLSPALNMKNCSVRTMW